MNKKIISFAVATGIIFGYSTTALADPNINQSRNLNEATKNRQNIESSVELLDSEIYKINIDVDKTKDKMIKVKKDIKTSEKDIKKAEDDIKKEQELFNQRMRAIYISSNNGMTGYLSILLEAESFSDFLSKAGAVKKVAKMDKDIIADLNGKKDKIEKKKVSLENENNELEKLKSNQEKKLAELNNKKTEQTRLIAQAREVENQYRSQINVAMNDARRMHEQAPPVSRGGGTTLPNPNGSSIVAYAYNFLGRPYVFGGNGPDVFDCSGFTKFVYGHFGVNLPRVADAQAGAGSYVSRGNLQPGDIVCFGQGYVHHVGIYVGDGCYIHAPHTGDVVKVSSLGSRGDFSGGRRIR